jgi:hypothetical protein
MQKCDTFEKKKGDATTIELGGALDVRDDAARTSETELIVLIYNYVQYAVLPLSDICLLTVIRQMMSLNSGRTAYINR